MATKRSGIAKIPLLHVCQFVQACLAFPISKLIQLFFRTWEQGDLPFSGGHIVLGFWREALAYRLRGLRSSSSSFGFRASFVSSDREILPPGTTTMIVCRALLVDLAVVFFFDHHFILSPYVPLMLVS